jgi:hypothetical protein
MGLGMNDFFVEQLEATTTRLRFSRKVHIVKKPDSSVARNISKVGGDRTIHAGSHGQHE